MRCPQCKQPLVSAGRASTVTDSRPNGPNGVRRRRKCLHCGARFSTQEVVVHDRRPSKVVHAIVNEQFRMPARVTIALRTMTKFLASFDESNDGFVSEGEGI